MTLDQASGGLLGRLELSSLPIWQAVHNPTTSELIAAGAATAVIIGAFAGLAFITWLGAWRSLWTDWLTSTDHKRIGRQPAAKIKGAPCFAPCKHWDGRKGQIDRACRR